MTDATTEIVTVTVERAFAHPPERIWRALTQPHLIKEWLMKNDFEAVVGHRFHLSGDWGGVLDCEVVAIEAGRLLSYSWNFANDDPAYALQSVVTFTLTPAGTGTHLRMDQAGFRPEQKQAIGGAKYGWQQFFGKLEQLLGRID